MRSKNLNSVLNSVKIPDLIINMLPKDTNGTGKNVFGGVLMHYMDMAALNAARKVCCSTIVTRAFENILFEAPIHVGDSVYFYGSVAKVGRTSLTIELEVFALFTGTRARKVASARCIFVAVDENERPTRLEMLN